MFFIFFEQKFVYFRNNNFYQIFMYIHISYHQSKGYMLQIKLELNHTFKNKWSNVLCTQQLRESVICTLNEQPIAFKEHKKLKYRRGHLFVLR